VNFLRSLRNRLLAGLFLLLLLFLALVFAGIGSLRAVNRAVEIELTTLAASSDLATDLVGSAADQVRVGESYLNHPSPEVGLEFLRLGDSTHSYRRRFRLLPGLTADDQSALNRVESSQAQMEVAYAEAHALRDLGKEAPALARAARARAPAESLIADVRELTGRQQRRVASRIEALRQRAGQREALVWLLFASAIVLGVGTAFVTVRSIDGPLQQLIDAARRFGDGDLRPTELGEMPAELATLARAMGQMGAKLRGVIDSVIRESKGIGLSAGDLSAMSEELAAGSSEIVRAIGGVTQNAGRQVEEVRSADEVIATWRETAARDATVAERVVAEGEQVWLLADHQRRDLTQAASTLASLRQSAQGGGAGARDLARSADRIAELLDLTRQLGAQSEVLALNAAIEAARTSDGGGGVSAIAEEARRLAEASRVATERVAAATEALRALVQGQSAAIQEIATGALNAETTVQRGVVALDEVGRTTDSLRNHAAHVVRSATESRAIAGRLADLRSRLEGDARETVSASESVTAAAGDQSSATGEIATSAAALLESSERLAALVADFKV
jgi:methyl-accepting chemotaxis protein